MFIAIEGIDFSGKSTQCKRLAKFLRGKGHEVILLREPGGTKISEKIRQLLLDKTNNGIDALTELFLYSASRAQLVSQVIKPALNSGKAIICDRFADSSTAYQGYGRGLDVDDVQLINRISAGGLEPDLTIVIDISPEDALDRLRLGRKSVDRIEVEGREFFERVRQGYLHLATRHKDRFKVVDGADDILNVQRRIEDVVVARFKI